MPQIVCRGIIEKNQNKDLENSGSNILDILMSRTSGHNLKNEFENLNFAMISGSVNIFGCLS